MFTGGLWTVLFRWTRVKNSLCYTVLYNLLNTDCNSSVYISKSWCSIIPFFTKTNRIEVVISFIVHFLLGTNISPTGVVVYRDLVWPQHQEDKTLLQTVVVVVIGGEGDKLLEEIKQQTCLCYLVIDGYYFIKNMRRLDCLNGYPFIVTIWVVSNH